MTVRVRVRANVRVRVRMSRLAHVPRLVRALVAHHRVRELLERREVRVRGGDLAPGEG